MAASKQIQNYLSNHYEGMAPEQLILLLFEGAIQRLRQAREGIIENDVKKRGENLSKAIAIISELNASVDPNMNDESTQFLRGLYEAILIELPKVSVDNNLRTLERSENYMQKLKEIWEKDVMGRTGRTLKKEAAPKLPETQSFPTANHKINNTDTHTSFRAISV